MKYKRLSMRIENGKIASIEVDNGHHPRHIICYPSPTDSSIGRFVYLTSLFTRYITRVEYHPDSLIFIHVDKCDVHYSCALEKWTSNFTPPTEEYGVAVSKEVAKST
jgi:hypothetical protein